MTAYLPQTDSEIRDMPAQIGLDSIDDISEDVRLKRPLNLAPGPAEADVPATAASLAGKNRPDDFQCPALRRAAAEAGWNSPRSFGAVEDAGADLAGVLVQVPNIYGALEHLEDWASAVHDSGGLLYCAGANLNAVMGHTRPEDMGFDVMHMNLHKTFSTPYGGGGPVLVRKERPPCLPVPVIEKSAER